MNKTHDVQSFAESLKRRYRSVAMTPDFCLRHHDFNFHWCSCEVVHIHRVNNSLKEAESPFIVISVPALLIPDIGCFIPGLSLTALLLPLPLPHSPASHPSLPSLPCGPGGASRTLSRAVSCRPAEDREIGMINNYNYWQTCQLLCGNGHLWFMVL